MKQLYDINSLASVLSVPPSDIFRIEISEVNRVLPGQIGDRYYCVIKPDRFICYYLKKGIINNQVSLLFKDFQEAKFYCKRGKLYFESNFKGYFFPFYAKRTSWKSNAGRSFINHLSKHLSISNFKDYKLYTGKAFFLSYFKHISGK